MIKKKFECITIILDDGFICYELERVAFKDEISKEFIFHLSHYSKDSKNKVIDEHMHFATNTELTNYFYSKFCELKFKGYN